MSQEERSLRMNATNPLYVLRNYLAQLAIDDAESGDFGLVNELLEVLKMVMFTSPPASAAVTLIGR